MGCEVRGTESVKLQQERAEVEAMLASEVFRRAPSLRQIFTYVCERYFAGESARIKEYTIAVEALGRGAEFDSASDTIVRVEASRLRKRLKEYYAGEGADHAVTVSLPGPGYIPQFTHRRPVEAGPPLEIIEPELVQQLGSRSWNLWSRVALGCVVASLLIGWALISAHSRPRLAPETGASPAVAAATDQRGCRGGPYPGGPGPPAIRGHLRGTSG